MVRPLALVLTFAALGFAADHPIAGDRLVLRDPSGHPSGRAMRFKAARDAGLDVRALPDPRTVATALTVVGTGDGDGAAGPIDLAAAGWEALGTPPGAKGWRWTDRARTDGVRTVVLKHGTAGGTLVVAGGGSGWPYAVTQAQEAVQLRLDVGADTWCARFDDFDRNRAGLVQARAAAAPADCAPPSGDVCGDGAVTGTEECDDGGTVPGDGCSGACTLESAAALCAGIPAASGTAVASQLVVDGLTRPTHVTAPPLDVRRLFVVEQEGLIRIVKDGALLPTPFLDIRGDVGCCGERGLLSVAFDPQFATTRRFWVNYTDNAGDTQVVRFTASAGNPDVADPTGTPVLAIDQDFPNHNGGQLAFGPDGFLYVGMGDGGSGGDPNERAQDPSQLLGKMLRLDVSGAGPGYVVPPSNPFVGAGDPRDEIWALGLRNPWRFSFDRGTGDLYVGDVGQGQWEEIDVQPAASAGGENYGWDVFEGDACFEPTPPATSCPVPPTGFTFPVLTYSHAEGCSLTGGFVYRGCRMPDLRGTYFYADYCTNFVRTFAGVSGGSAQNRQDRTAALRPSGGFGGITSFGEDARGEIHVVDQGGAGAGAGKLWRIVPGS